MKKIRKSVLILCMICSGLTAGAQNFRSVSMAAGLLYPNTVDATLSYDVETKYHNAWEFFINGTAGLKECPLFGNECDGSFWKEHTTWGVGAAWKPCVYRRRNTVGRVRAGASLGSNNESFLGGIHLGYEQNYALKGGWCIFWQVKGDCLIRNSDLFRVGAVIGIAVPFNLR